MYWGTADQIPTIVNSLTPVQLRAATAVVDHGFADGQVVDTPAVLAPGTAVFIDARGVPTVKCVSGDPLTAPLPGTVPSTATVINPTAQPIKVNVFVNPATGQSTSSPGKPDRPGHDNGGGGNTHYGDPSLDKQAAKAAEAAVLAQRQANQARDAADAAAKAVRAAKGFIELEGAKVSSYEGSALSARSSAAQAAKDAKVALDAANAQPGNAALQAASAAAAANADAAAARAKTADDRLQKAVDQLNKRRQDLADKEKAAKDADASSAAAQAKAMDAQKKAEEAQKKAEDADKDHKGDPGKDNGGNKNQDKEKGQNSRSCQPDRRPEQGARCSRRARRP